MGKVIILGSGSSCGIPVIGCKCKVCKSTTKFNKRLRPSILIKSNSQNILVDVGPDIRYQALKYNLQKIDFIIITHAHFDHIAGLDDLREITRKQKKPLKCFLSNDSYKEIEKRFDYFFRKNIKGHTQSVKFDFQILNLRESIKKLSKNEFSYFSYFQDTKRVLGLRFKNFAYITDIKKYDENIFNNLKDLDVLVLSCLRLEKSSVHFNIEEAVEFAKKVNAKKTYFTHIAHEIEHKKITKILPNNIFLSYDGQEIKF